MGLLRACADAVLVGSGTMVESPGTLWTAERAYPPTADAYAELRRRLGLPPRPEVAIVTASGLVDVAHPVLEQRRTRADHRARSGRARRPPAGRLTGRRPPGRRPGRRARGSLVPARPRPRPDPLRRRPDPVRFAPRGRSRRRALPDDLAPPRRPLAGLVPCRPGRGGGVAARAPDAERGCSGPASTATSSSSATASSRAWTARRKTWAASRTNGVRGDPEDQTPSGQSVASRHIRAKGARP